MKKMLFLYLSLFLSTLVFAQTDKNLKFQEIIGNLSCGDLENGKKMAEKDLIQSSSISNQILGYAALVYYYQLQPSNIYQREQLKALKKAEDLYNKNNDDRNKAYLQYGYMLYYQKTKRHDKFTEYFNRSINILKKLADENFLITAIHFAKIEYIEDHYSEKFNSKDIFETLEFAKKSKNNWQLSIAYNNIGNIYEVEAVRNGEPNLILLDSSAIYYKKMYEVIPKIKNKIEKDIAYFYYYNNISGIYYFKKNYQLAVDLLKKSYKIVENYPNILRDKINTLYNIGYCLEAMGDIKSAESYYLKGYNLIEDDLQTSSKIMATTKLLYFYKSQGKFEKSLEYSQELADYIIEEYEELNKGLDTFNEIESEKILLEEKNEALIKQRFLYIALTILSIFALVGLLMLSFNRQKLQKQERILWEEEQRRLKAEKELVEMKKEQLQKKHLATTVQLSHKNTILSEIKESSSKNLDHSINTLFKEDLLLDDDVKTIQETILNVHPEFFNRLKEKSNNSLSQLELKYAVLIYLHLDNRQIANYMKADVNAVRVSKYRIKKKLNLGKEVILDDFIQNIQFEN